MRGLRAGLLDLVLARGNEEELKGALAQWPEPVVWVRAPDFSMDPGAPVPLITSPNLLPVDRIAVAALEAAKIRYEVVFTAFDTMARRAAVAAGLAQLESGHYDQMCQVSSSKCGLVEPFI